MEYVQALDVLSAGDHLCYLYSTEAEHQLMLGTYLRQGLKRHEKVLYLADAHSPHTIEEYVSRGGMEVEAYVHSGQLSIRAAKDVYTPDGVFDPDDMIKRLRTETQRALDEGYAAFRVTGEMSWALDGPPGSERLIEYESKLNEFFPTNASLAICQYDMEQFDPEILLDVFATHPYVLIGTELYQNFYYIPPDEIALHGIAAASLQHWIRNLGKQKQLMEKLAIH